MHDSNPFPEMEIEFPSFLLWKSEQNMLPIMLFSDSCHFPYLKRALHNSFPIYIEYQ